MSESAQLPSDARDYLQRCRLLTEHVDSWASSPASDAIMEATASLAALPTVDAESLTAWLASRPKDVYTLAVAVGLTQEKLKNLMKAEFGTETWAKAAKEDAAAVVLWLDTTFGVVDVLNVQLGRSYSMGDVLVGRAMSRVTASRAGVAGKSIEDQVEKIVRDLGLPYQMRGRFVGMNGNTGPADLVIPDFSDAKITVACKGFDSTGSKLTAAVDEVEKMAQVRYAHQHVFAVVDGIGWANRLGDFRRMFALAESGRINGLYTLADLERFRDDLSFAARLHKLLV